MQAILFTVGLPCALLVGGAAVYRSGDATAFSGRLYGADR